MSEHPNQTERVGFIRGPVTSGDESLLATLGNRLGLQITFQVVTAYTQPVDTFSTGTQLLRPPSPLSEITSPEDWLVREHFDEHRRLTRRFSSNTVSNAFHSLVDARPLQARQEGSGYNAHTGQYVYDKDARAHPFKGIVVVERADAGFIPYNTLAPKLSPRARSFAKFAIQAGSLQMAEDMVQAKITGFATRVYLQSLIARLNRQIQT